MSDYRYPYQDALFVLNELVDIKAICRDAGFEELADDLAETILSEAAKWGEERLAPLNRIGDQQGACLADQTVHEAPGFAEAYQQFCESGWPSLGGDPDFGGQGLPAALSVAANEVWQSANLSWALCPLLTQGAIAALETHGSEKLQQCYLPRLISGEWVATMNLTEPDAGTDLAAIKTKAVPDGSYYRISGQKIFITWGDHQMTENIVHLVLARLPDAPEGVKGISLFLVPKFILDEQGNSTQARNDVYPVALEHKLGIHASPTCVMSYGENEGAIGYLLGKPHQGLACMFTMMNDARQAVGLQGLAVSERAYQQAVNYAKERVQGTLSDGSRFTIIKHPDVRRMLMQMKVLIQAMRAMAYVARAEADHEKSAEDRKDKVLHHARTELYTPIVKGWMTEIAQEVTGLAVQVHGGMGFIEETGVAQHYRDARILTIYEGTTGIQALDLIGRKILADDGATVGRLLDEIQKELQNIHFESIQNSVNSTQEASVTAKDSIQWLLENTSSKPDLAGTASVNLMMLLGYLIGGWLLIKSADKALVQIQKDGDNDFLQSKVVCACFYAEQILPRVDALAKAIRSGEVSTMGLTEEQF